MKLTQGSSSRRAFLKSSAAGLGALGAATSVFSATGHTSALPTPAAASKPPASDIAVWVTGAKQRFAAGQPIAWQPAPATPAPDAIQLVATNKFQDILGFGGCFSDAACYVISQLHEPAREKLLREMFHPSEMGLSVNRTCIGAADSAATLYSYDDGDADPELKRFSIDHDRDYILPVLRRVHEINPEVFYFSSPGAPPAG
jgi:glucosylceramidase